MYFVRYGPSIAHIAEEHLGFIFGVVAPLTGFAHRTLPGVFAHVNQHGRIEISTRYVN
ncbi:hypothetical protein J6590_040282 [Homalodisca vitripennis]|nr:hypothetical protein J6590_040282 [Homalodisca vitripennis]